jgi:sarcosine oxidase subunit alpha
VLGGSLNYSRLDAKGTMAREVRDLLVQDIEANSNITCMTNATVNAWFADNWLPIICQKRLYKVRAKQTILCTGALEQQAVFHNNDVPGVMMSSAAQRLIHLYGMRPGKTAVIVTGNDDGYANALDLADAGVEVAAIVDLRDKPRSSPLVNAAKKRGLSIKAGYAVYAAQKRAIIYLLWRFAKYSARGFVALSPKTFAVTCYAWQSAIPPPISSPVRLEDS